MSLRVGGDSKLGEGRGRLNGWMGGGVDRPREIAANRQDCQLCLTLCQRWLTSTVDEKRIQRDHLLPDLPNAEAYPIDYRMEGKSGGQVFLYGVPNRDKARLTTIILSHFHRNHLDFDSILVFSDQAETPRMDLARLSDVGGDMVSSLASSEDFRRKVERRIG